MKEVRPIHVLLILLGTMLGLAVLGLVFPTEGIYFSERFSLRFPNTLSYFVSSPVAEKKDISKILALADEADSIGAGKIVADSLKDTLTSPVSNIPLRWDEIGDTLLKSSVSIQYPDAEKSALHNFFHALVECKATNNRVRVLHYGDSQIEGDRMTDYFRMKLQNEFGGYGTGLISVAPVAQSVAVRQTWSDNWMRYGVFTSKDSRVKHSNFGVLSHFARFKNYSSGNDTNIIDNAWVNFKISNAAGARAAKFDKIKILYGGAQSKVSLQYIENNALAKTDCLLVGGNNNILEIVPASNLNSFELKFRGTDSPDIYGISLEGDGGVIVDNIALRGSSGTFFNQINSSQLRTMYEELKVKLIILQFGGNTLPYVKTKSMADNIGSYLKSQILLLKRLAPGASILVIGPADMSVKEGEEYVTHPQLENLRDAIRKSAFDCNCAFFDMYECMGGRNSMVSWVEAGIAAKDYIHFSSYGARKIATLLYAAMIRDFNAFIKRRKEES